VAGVGRRPRRLGLGSNQNWPIEIKGKAGRGATAEPRPTGLSMRMTAPRGR